MVKLYNIDENKNIIISDQKSIFKVIEYKMDLTAKNSEQAMQNYYLSRACVLKKQVMITLKGDSVLINSGTLQFVTGDIDVKSNIKNVGDFLSKTLSGTITGEGTIKPMYYGTGHIMLAPTYSYIILEEVKSGDGIIISDASFLACSAGIKLKIVASSTISSAMFGQEGVFNVLLKGDGVVCFTSPQPKSDIILVHLENDILRVNGSLAIAWTEKLDFSVELLSSSIMGNAVIKEKYTNVYKGTGIVWLATEKEDI